MSLWPEWEEREREEQERLEREEEERMTCPFCGNKVQKGFYVDLYGKNFHFECKEKFENSEAGKNWIQEQEAEIKRQQEEARIESERKREIKRQQEEIKRQQEEKAKKIELKELEKDEEWYNSPFSKKFKEKYGNIDEITEWNRIREAREKFQKERAELDKWLNSTGAGLKALRECSETDEYVRYEKLKVAKLAFEQKQEEDKKRAEEKKTRQIAEAKAQKEREAKLAEARLAEEKARKEYEEKLAKIKSKKIKSAVLCFFFGYLGLHDFYNKKHKSGIMKLCLLILFPQILMHFMNSNAKGEMDLPTVLMLIDFAILFLWINIDFFRILAGKFVKIK